MERQSIESGLEKVLESFRRDFRQRQKILIMVSAFKLRAGKSIPYPKAVRACIVRLAAREILKAEGISPRRQKEEYNARKPRMRKEIILLMEAARRKKWIQS
ncbi:MAG: hypothetical protein WC602_04715 [archaeon]